MNPQKELLWSPRVEPRVEVIAHPAVYLGHFCPVALAALHLEVSFTV